MPIGGSNAYPAILDVTNLVRSMVQDDMAGATDTVGEGQVFVDNMLTSVTMGNFFNSSLRQLSRKLRTTTGPMLIRDNIIISGLPPLFSPTQGLAAPDPSIQTNLSFVGYFNGLNYDSTWVLPIDCLMVDVVSERITGSNDDFCQMGQPALGLISRWQGVYNNSWEWRQDGIWMPGSIQTMDLRLRYQAKLPTLYTQDIDPSMTYIPIVDCEEAMAGLMIQMIAIRQGASVLPAVLEWARDHVNDFLNEQIKRDQGDDYPIIQFGSDGLMTGQR